MKAYLAEGAKTQPISSKVIYWIDDEPKNNLKLIQTHIIPNKT